MGRKRIHVEFLWESQKERDHWEDLDVGGITLKRILEREDAVIRTGLIWLRIGIGSCEHGNEPSGSIKSWEILE
jgi:hypothetical protein